MKKEFELDRLKSEMPSDETDIKKGSNAESNIADARKISHEMLVLRKEQKDMRDQECARILREYKLRNYGLRFNVTLEKTLSSLFGLEYAKSILDKEKKKK